MKAINLELNFCDFCLLFMANLNMLISSGGGGVGGNVQMGYGVQVQPSGQQQFNGQQQGVMGYPMQQGQ